MIYKKNYMINIIQLWFYMKLGGTAITIVLKV